jgi:molecular chaperone GrpE
MSDTEHGPEGAPQVKVVDRRWWARGETPAGEPETAGKPTYVEELEQRLAEKDRLLQGYVEQFKSATAEFEQARARTRRDAAREIERGQRVMLVELLDVIDNLDRAVEAGRETRNLEALLQGVELARQQFLARLDGFGIQRIEALGQPFDPRQHEAVSVVPCTDEHDDERVVGVIRCGYRAGAEVLRPALVAVGRRG